MDFKCDVKPHYTVLNSIFWEQLLNISQVSQSVLSNSLRPHGLQHARPPCPSPTPGACSFMSIESVMPSNHLVLCCPLSSHLQSFLASGSFPMSQFFAIRVQSCWSYWSFSFSISPSSEYSGLISFRIDWFDLLEVQGTLSRVFFNTRVQKH